MDYASPSTKEKALIAIHKELNRVPDGNKLKQQLLARVDEVKSGKRDLYF